MRLPGVLYTAKLLAIVAASAKSADHVRQVAIIGAGAAGSSTAYYLRQFAEEDGVAVNITLFEKTGRIGGRALTVNAYDDPDQRVELGASIFVEINQILWNATEKFGLSLDPPVGEIDGVLGIWDGDRFVYTQDETSSNWWNLAKLFWKYGLAPYRANNLMQATVSKFLSLYTAPYFPFRSLSARAFELELAQVTSQTGAQFLEQNKIAFPFSHDIIQASTRVNYASNLDTIHGLDTMGASQVAGGNWKIFANFVRDSNADFRDNTLVKSISFASDSTNKAPKYNLKTKSSKTAETAQFEFDNVVIAAPYQFSGIKSADSVLTLAIDEIPYVTLYVTLFTSPLLLSPEFFNLEPGTKAPSTVLTTLGADESSLSDAGKAGFFSISTLRTITNPRTERSEYLYKIFSPKKVTASFLSELLGAEVPETFTAPAETASVISWYYPYIFHAYPKALPRVTFQDPIVGNGVYYTSGIESFISTMETSALSGMNVARLIVDDIQGLATGEAVDPAASAAKAQGQQTEDL
ncbi:prenylcysteine oxidoreductase [Grosmannia clavigera kw1407]|uniref:Prenylcysteine oxidoreductase n=1 Tax=Grosmannia clavigera (strain kw1407 / UAMH 11150) TaxID=655863 RepID=F0XFY6_GROCL|nr:prenylcysteine oxidoreductase [Grosmannia clavigera kw1407]EFX03369.1 prenylcysteine oxidoreductase [Grosmannia clavigera kw1407]